ncbi:MAG: hypothetical protein JSU73_05740 [candidate division WOR-3 bacterium]|nr:MAG: hypothetical protein JSU73_05740 [candidate division WOR-3 bacterium]
MTRTLEWEGRKIEMRIYFTPRLLMFATDTTLCVDGRRVARKGGFGITETAVGSFRHKGKEIQAELQVRGNRSVFTRIPYVLRFDGSPVSEGRLRLERVPIAAAVWLSLAGLFILLALTI